MAFVYNQGATDMLDGTIDYLTDTIIVMLVGSSYSANKDDDFVDEGGVNEPIDEELSGTGYVAGHGNSGRKTLASKTVTVDKTNDRVTIDAADVSWTGIDAGTATQAVVHRQGTSNDTDAILMFHIDGGDFPIVTNGGDVTIVWASTGIAYLQQ